MSTDILSRFIGLTGLALSGFGIIANSFGETDKQLSSLIVYRNLAFLASNVVVKSSSEALDDKWDSYSSFEFDTAKTAMGAIDYKNIVPEPLAREFIDIWHMTERTQRLIDKRSADKSELQTAHDKVQKAIGRINRCIFSTGLALQNEEGLAYRDPPISWSWLFWHAPRRGFCDLSL